MGLSIAVKAGIFGEYSLPPELDGTVYDIKFEHFAMLTTGTLANQADKLWKSTRTLAASANETIDLTALTNAYNEVTNLARVKAILIASQKTNTTELQFGPNASNGFVTIFGSTSDRIRINPGGAFLHFAYDAIAYTVSPTGRLLYVSNAAGAAATYDIMIVGASA